MNTKICGNYGEEKACRYLIEKNYSILTRNYRTRRGEIDIIACKDDSLVFIEVKTLPSGNIETLSHLLGKNKRKRIAETSKRFLQKYRQYNRYYIRFDVIIIDMPEFQPVYHIENAFYDE
ncbi:MAG: YraN family protein [Treponemataceae bacterium]|nr:YraN family protein [Treponemataceae bacterium]